VKPVLNTKVPGGARASSKDGKGREVADDSSGYNYRDYGRGREEQREDAVKRWRTSSWSSGSNTITAAPALPDATAPWRSGSNSGRSWAPSRDHLGKGGSSHSASEDTRHRGAEKTEKQTWVDTKRVFVGGLGTGVTETHIRGYFSKYGQVMKVTMRIGFCYVKMEHEEIVRRVLEDYEKHRIADKWVECQACCHFGLPRGTLLKDHLCVAGLEERDDIGDFELKHYFSRYGPVKEVDLQRNRGVAFIVFESCSTVQLALHDYLLHRINGVWVEVKPVVDAPGNSKETAAGVGGVQGGSAVGVSSGSGGRDERDANGHGHWASRSALHDRSDDMRGSDSSGIIQDQSRLNNRDQQWDDRCAGGNKGGGGVSSRKYDRQQATNKNALLDSAVAEEREDKVDVKSLTLAGLPESVQPDDIREYFLQYGHLTHVDSSWKNGRCQIMYESAEEVKSVLKDYDRHWLHEKWIECSACGTFGLSNSSAHSSVDKFSIFVGGLPSKVTADRLEQHFRRFGRVTKVDIKDKGFAFITFGSGADVQLALHAYKDHFIEEKWIEVKPMLLSKARSGGGDSGGGSSGGASAAGAHAGWDGAQDRHRSDGGRYSDDPGWRSANKPEWGGNSSWGGCSGGEWKGRGDSWRSRPY